MVKQLMGVRIGGAARELNGVCDFRANFSFDFFQRAFMHALLEQTGARPGNGIFWQPVLKLVLALHAYVEIHGGADMAPPAISTAFEQRRTAASTRTARRIDGGSVDHADVVAVQAKRLDAMRISGLDDVVFDAALPDVHVTRIEIVFANENDRKTVQAGKVKRLMKMTF